MSDQFWTMLAAVLGGNLLTAVFVWGAVTRTRMERTGDHDQHGRFPALCMLMPLLFLIAAMYISDTADETPKKVMNGVSNGINWSVTE